MNELEILGKIYWAGFHKPELETAKFQKIWLDVIPQRSELSECLLDILSPERNSSVNKLIERLGGVGQVKRHYQMIAAEYKKILLTISPGNVAEERDLLIICGQGDVLEVLSFLAGQAVEKFFVD